MMRIKLFIACLTLLGAHIHEIGFAQETEQKASSDNNGKQAEASTLPEQATANEGKKVEMPKYPYRLPENFGRLALNDQQRNKVYEIQSRFHKQILELEKQLAILKEQQNQEVQTVLTPGQRLRLNEILAEKAAEKAKKKQP